MEQRDAIQEFIKAVGRKHKAGNATELSYRSDLEQLCNVIGAGVIHTINEAKRIECGAPDLTMMHGEIAIGYLEAKDIGVNIRKFKKANKNQFDRYTNDLDNLIYTNCLDWDFYLNGERMHSVSIAELKGGKIISKDNKTLEKLARYLQDFLDQRPQTITTAEALTQYMAKRTRMMRHAFEESLLGDNPVRSLRKQYKTVVKELIRGLKEPEFADMYAQTVTYGLFAAWIDNKTPDKFNRKEIQELLPDDFPFLKNLFEFITAKTQDKGLDWSINDLISVYRAANADKIKKAYAKDGERSDIFIHFYEDFLQKYDAEKRKKAGVYYTPESVVDYIVRAVDWVLKDKFNLPKGLAHSGKTGIKWKTDKVGELKDEDVHKVQILDPATGTGTFLAQTIRHIAESVKKSTANNWSSYVDKDLLPRLHGLELMMAPYTMCYLKLDRVLKELKYEATDDKPKRMRIYLNNSLTEANKDISELGYNEWLENEARGVSNIKDNYPIMCVIGNPPYAGESTNQDPWIKKLINDYKTSPELKKPAQAKWLSNDYVKFIRMAQHMVEKNGEGVVGMITDHSYLYNPTFRDMRWHLMNSFDFIYILDLHGNSLKKEVTPEGEPDKNIFDIREGVAILIAWKKKQKKGADKPLAQVFLGDLWGTRAEKIKDLKTQSKVLSKNGLDSELFEKLEPRAPRYFFTARHHGLPDEYDPSEEYEAGFKITEFMPGNAPGIITTHDQFAISWNAADARKKIKTFLATETEDEARDIWKLCAQDQWNYNKAKTELANDEWRKQIREIVYRPFDIRTTIYNPKVAVHLRHKRVMRHFLDRKNLGLTIGRQGQVVGSMDWNVVFIQDQISDVNIFYRGGGTVFPLYTYPDEIKNLDTNGHSKRINMDETIRERIENLATDKNHKKPNEVEIFDYIYGILHTPEYRTRYAISLKTDFPIIPYPETPDEFWRLSSVGKTLRELHLMKSKLDTDAYTFNGKGRNIVVAPKYKNGKVWINETQYFDNVPKRAWEFHIGGYKPAQKWLKDRAESLAKNREAQTLEQLDLEHYQRIIAVLVKTYETMDEIVWTR